MDLLNRMCPENDRELIALEQGEGRIPSNTFGQILREYVRGAHTKASIVVVFTLDTAAAAELGRFLALVDASPATEDKLRMCHEIEDVITLGIWGASYASRAEIKTRLGI